MAGLLGKYQMLTFNHWMGLTKNNHLGSIFQLQPQRATNTMVQLLAYHRGKTLNTYLSQFPTKEFDDDNEYFWDVISTSDRNIPLIEARNIENDPITSGMAGVNGRPFYLVFGEDWFANGNVIVGELNEYYPLRVLESGRPEGSNTIYKVELMGGIMTGMPAEQLTIGKRFSVEYSPVESELSRKVGDIRFSSPVSIRNEFSTIRIQHKVPGSMLGKKVAIGIPFVNPQTQKIDTVDTWMHHVEWQVDNTFDSEKNNLIMYGRSNRNRNGEYMNIGQSGNVIKMGAGLREQNDVSNVIWYNDFDLEIINDALYALSAAKLPMNDRVFVMRTGERGAAQFHSAIQKITSGWERMVINNDKVKFVENVSSKLHSNALAAGFQFVEFRAPNGVIVKVEVDPFYDNPIRNKILLKGAPAESYRYDIMYIGSMDQPNIQLAKIKGDSDLRSYQWGLRNPFTGQKGNPNASFDEDAAIIHRMWTGGVFILDPTRTVAIIPSVLAG